MTRAFVRYAGIEYSGDTEVNIYLETILSNAEKIRFVSQSVGILWTFGGFPTITFAMG